MCVRARAYALVLCFVMGYMLQFGDKAHKRVAYYYWFFLFKFLPVWGWRYVCGGGVGEG